jgi:hypothetical protein
MRIKRNEKKGKVEGKKETYTSVFSFTSSLGKFYPFFKDHFTTVYYRKL